MRLYIENNQYIQIGKELVEKVIKANNSFSKSKYRCQIIIKLKKI